MDENKTNEETNVGAGVAPIVQEEMPSAPSNPVVASISKRLEGEEEKSNINPDAPTTSEPKPAIDLTALTPEQLAVLKQMLAGAPDRILKTKGNPTCTLREFKGKVIVDFKNSFLALKTDTVERRDKEVHFIPVKFMGEDKFVDIELFDFHNANKITCEIISHKSEKKEFFEGKTISRETGTEVEMFKYEVFDTFTLKLPTGEVVEINGKVSNA